MNKTNSTNMWNTDHGSRGRTPQKEKEFVKNIIMGAGSNYEKIVPTFVGVSISELGQTKKGDRGFGEQFGRRGKNKLSRIDYEAKVVIYIYT